MRIGILEAGNVAPALVPAHGTYPAMFEHWLAPAAPGFSFRSYRACDGVLPASATECDGWLVTASKHGVYDDLPWIAPLGEFLRQVRTARRPVVGVCFGHQMLAQAWGGRAAKFEGGWGLGLQRYDILARPSWMADAGASIAIHAIHQDQVLDLPPDATVLATSRHCRHAMLAYGDPEQPDGISIQPHPEFGAEYTRDLIGRRSGQAFDRAAGESALASLGAATDAPAVARWAATYLRRAAAARQAA